MSNPTAAIISDDTFELDGVYYPALLTYEPFPCNTYVIDIVPITDDPRLSHLRVILGRKDLEDLNAMRAHCAAPSEPPEPSDSYDGRTVDEWVTEIEQRMNSDQDKLVQQYAGLSERIFTIEERSRRTAERVRLGLPAAEYVREHYDEYLGSKTERPTYWDIKLLAMIELLSERLAMAVGGG